MHSIISCRIILNVRDSDRARCVCLNKLVQSSTLTSPCSTACVVVCRLNTWTVSPEGTSAIAMECGHVIVTVHRQMLKMWRQHSQIMCRVHLLTCESDLKVRLTAAENFRCCSSVDYVSNHKFDVTWSVPCRVSVTYPLCQLHIQAMCTAIFLHFIVGTLSFRHVWFTHEHSQVQDICYMLYYGDTNTLALPRNLNDIHTQSISSTRSAGKCPSW